MWYTVENSELSGILKLKEDFLNSIYTETQNGNILNILNSLNMFKYFRYLKYFKDFNIVLRF